MSTDTGLVKEIMAQPDNGIAKLKSKQNED